MAVPQSPRSSDRPLRAKHSHGISQSQSLNSSRQHDLSYVSSDALTSSYNGSEQPPFAAPIVYNSQQYPMHAEGYLEEPASYPVHRSVSETRYVPQHQQQHQFPSYVQRLVAQIDPSNEPKRAKKSRSQSPSVSSYSSSPPTSTHQHYPIMNQMYASLPMNAPPATYLVQPPYYPQLQQQQLLAPPFMAPYAMPTMQARSQSRSEAKANDVKSEQTSNKKASRKVVHPNHPFLSRERKRAGYGEREEEAEYAMLNTGLKPSAMPEGPINWQPDTVTYDKLFMEEQLRTNPEYIYFDIWMAQFMREKNQREHEARLWAQYQQQQHQQQKLAAAQNIAPDTDLWDEEEEEEYQEHYDDDQDRMAPASYYRNHPDFEGEYGY
eukprot:GILI01009586.1.p1 GENE.GILI01009586.1~~GILI01009586.1.p1  ORF type:complete len:398 (+),score=61.00 GILI01009586.1:59-1195(+)